MRKIYKIDCDINYEKACYSALKKVFSVTLFPRILINVNFKNFDKKLKKYAEFICFNAIDSQIFAKKVHNGYFDIGVFFFKKDNKTYLKVYDGTGHLAGNFVTNIFDKIFAMNNKEFELEKINIQNQYKSLNKNKLLKQKL